MRSGLLLLVGFVALLWVVEGVNALVGHGLNDYGLAPLALPYQGLGLFEPSVSYFAGAVRGIALSPLLHGDFSHLLSNTLGLAVLGGLVALRGAKTLAGASLVIILLGGALVWLVGRPAIHIGASGLLFGFFGYLVARGWYERSFWSIVVAVVVAVFYGGGIVVGALPQGGFISWEAHLFGLIAGVVAARHTRGTGDADELSGEAELHS